MPWQESAIRGLDSMPGPAMRAPVRTSRRSNPKWIAPDGRSFWLVWTDFQEGGGTGARQAPWPARDGASEEEIRRRLLVPQPYYAFKRAARRPGLA